MDERPQPAPTPVARKRWPRAEREQFIVERAAELFAERGFGLSTRELASALDVTQALLYQYFASKEALINAVFERTFFYTSQEALTGALADDRQPLEERLVAFYETFVTDHLTAKRQRLFLRANLDGLDLARRFSLPLNARVLEPVVSALRRECAMADLEDTPMSDRERELAMMLHGGIVFLGLRKHVYRTASIGSLAAHVRSHVRVFLAGALDEMAREDR